MWWEVWTRLEETLLAHASAVLAVLKERKLIGLSNIVGLSNMKAAAKQGYTLSAAALSRSITTHITYAVTDSISLDSGRLRHYRYGRQRVQWLLPDGKG